MELIALMSLAASTTMNGKKWAQSDELILTTQGDITTTEVDTVMVVVAVNATAAQEEVVADTFRRSTAGAMVTMKLPQRMLTMIKLTSPQEAPALSLVLQLVQALDVVKPLVGDLGEVCTAGVVGIKYTY